MNNLINKLITNYIVFNNLYILVYIIHQIRVGIVFILFILLW